MKRNFIITVDTEGDNQWSIYNGQNITTENANFIPRFQEMCEEFGFKPVYLVNYEMANNDFLMDYLKKNKKKEFAKSEHISIRGTLHLSINWKESLMLIHTLQNTPSKLFMKKLTL